MDALQFNVFSLWIFVFPEPCMQTSALPTLPHEL